MPLLDDGFLRGDAVFETVLVRRGRTHMREAHLARMRASAKTLDLRLPLLKRPIEDLLAAWGEADGALKLIATRSGVVRGLLTPIATTASLSLHVVEAPWHTAVSGAKTLSYAANQWADRTARAAHADHALIVSAGTVMELPTAAIGWLRRGTVHAPDPTTLPILDSITLRTVEQVEPVARGTYALAAVLDADAVFVASATRPVVPVHAIDDHEFPTDHEQLLALRGAVGDHIDASLD